MLAGKRGIEEIGAIIIPAIWAVAIWAGCQNFVLGRWFLIAKNLLAGEVLGVRVMVIDTDYSLQAELLVEQGQQLQSDFLTLRFWHHYLINNRDCRYASIMTELDCLHDCRRLYSSKMAVQGGE